MNSLPYFPTLRMLRAFSQRLSAVAVAVAAVVAFVPQTRAAPSVPLVKISESLYCTEHCLFIIGDPAQITWSQYSSVYSQANMAGYIATLQAQFPGDYFSICLMANNLTPNSVPNYIHARYKATGIYDFGTPGVPDYVRYNLGGGTVITGALAVFDHEIGHAWGVQVLNQPGHWLSNSTVECQMSDTYSDDGYVTVKQIYGDETAGFFWSSVNNTSRNETETFSDQMLYLMGLHPTLPTFYVLNDPVYNADHTMSFSSVTKYDHAAMVAAYGVRTPDFRTSQKHFKFGFVYIARDLAEVNTVFSPIEQSAAHFCDAEAIDTTHFRFQVPFLVETKFRASAEGRLADLDGNAAPTLSVDDTYVASSDGTATIHFTASDPDGSPPEISVVGSTASWSVVGNTVQLSGLTDGVLFFSMKAQDAGGKKAFGNFVVETQIVPVAPSIASQPQDATVTTGAGATFSVSASGVPAPAYQWFFNGGAIAGATSASFSIANAQASDAGSYTVVVSNSAGTVMSSAATLTVNPPPPPPSIVSQPSDATVAAGGSASFSVSATGAAPLSYQWYHAGNAIVGAINASYALASAQLSDAGSYSVLVTDLNGSTLSSAATLTVNVPPPPPSITTQPASLASLVGSGVAFSVVATNATSFQWFKDGTAVPGATGSTFAIPNAQATDGGSYTCVVTGESGSITSSAAVLTVLSARLVNISTRSLVGTGGDIQIGGFIISGAEPKRVLLRASGPALTALGVAGALEDPLLILMSGQNVIAQNDDWDPSLGGDFTAVHAFAWAAGSKDAALVATLAPGSYTAHVLGKNNSTGVALVEVYDADATTSTTSLVNISTRSLVGAGGDIQIGGFVIAGDTAKKVLVRASGPALDGFGLAGALGDPVLSLFSGQTQIAQNDDWDPSLASIFTAVNAFAWTPGSKDAALVLILQPGAYTAQVAGKNGATGVALIEVYDVGY